MSLQQREVAESKLEVALDKHDFGALIGLIESGLVSVQYESMSGDTPLISAAWWGDTAVLKWLVRMGADLNYVNKRGSTALIEALKARQIATADLLLSIGASVDTTNLLDETALHVLLHDLPPDASADDQRDLVALLDYCIQQGCAVDHMSAYGSSALMLAASKHLVVIVEYLLQAGANVNMVGPHDTPLICALDGQPAGALATMELLLTWTADPNLEAGGGNTCLLALAPQTHWQSKLQCLLQAGANVNAMNKNMVTPLYLAAKLNKPDLIQALIAAGAVLDRESDVHVTELIVAARQDAAAALYCLLDAGADGNRFSGSGMSPLMEATQFGKLTAMQALLQGGVQPDAVSPVTKNTALTQAVKLKSMDAVQLLLQYGASPLLDVEGADSPIFAAIVAGDTPILERLLAVDGSSDYLQQHRALISAAAMEGTAGGIVDILHEQYRQADEMEAALAIHRELVARLNQDFRDHIKQMVASGWGAGLSLGSEFLSDTLDDKIESCDFKAALRILQHAQREHELQGTVAGEDKPPPPSIHVNRESPAGYTILLKAAGRGDTEAVKIALSMGADPNLLSATSGHTPLTWASAQGQADVVRLLLQAGGNPDTETPNGSTALLEACYWGFTSVVRRLIRAGANVNLESSTGRTPLSEACDRMHVQVARLLLDAGADPSYCNAQGYTPAMIAAKRGSLELLELLIAHKSDTKYLSPLGINALHEARSFGSTACLQLLLKVNCLDKVDKAIRRWEFGQAFYGLQRWAHAVGIQLPSERSRSNSADPAATTQIRRLSVLTYALGWGARRVSFALGGTPTQSPALAPARRPSVVHHSLLAMAAAAPPNPAVEQKNVLVRSQPLANMLTEWRSALGGNLTVNVIDSISTADHVLRIVTEHFMRYLELMNYIHGAHREVDGREPSESVSSDTDSTASTTNRRASVTAGVPASAGKPPPARLQTLLDMPRQLPFMTRKQLLGFPESLVVAVEEFTGNKDLTIQLVAVLAAAVKKFAHHHRRIELFSTLVGLHEPTAYNGLASYAGLAALRYLVLEGHSDFSIATGASTRNVIGTNVVLPYAVIEATTAYIVLEAMGSPSVEAALAELRPVAGEDAPKRTIGCEELVLLVRNLWKSLARRESAAIILDSINI